MVGSESNASNSGLQVAGPRDGTPYGESWRLDECSVSLPPAWRKQSDHLLGGLRCAIILAQLVETRARTGPGGRFRWAATTAELRVRNPSAESATRRDQGPRAGMRNGLAIDEASPNDLPEKQDVPPERLAYVRCDVGCEVERETGIEPV